MQPQARDQHWMAAAVALSRRSHALSAPNPNVGCLLVKHGRVLGRGVTAAGGRPHAEAAALAQACEGAKGATAYVTLEPCAHVSARGPSCADSLIAAGVARVVIATQDPDLRTNGQGIARLQDAGVAVELGMGEQAARAAMAGWWTRQTLHRPFITLKMATSLDGCIAMADGSSQWITGDRARAHGHLERARHQAILVGRGTYDADAPRLDVRLSGLEGRSPHRLLLSNGPAPESWSAVSSPEAAADMSSIDSILIEGGAGAATAFLQRDMVDRLLLYRAPILIGAGRHSLGDIGLPALPEAHDRWALKDRRQLGRDQLEIYERIRKE